MRVSTDLLLSASAATASYTFKHSHLRFNRNLSVSRNKTLCNVFSTYYAHHIDLIIVVYRAFDWRISRAIFHFILFWFVFVGSQIQLCQKFDKPLFERGPLIPNNIRKCSYPNRHCSVSGNYISNFSVFSSIICGNRNSENLSVVGYSVYLWRNIIQSQSLQLIFFCLKRVPLEFKYLIGFCKRSRINRIKFI